MGSFVGFRSYYTVPAVVVPIGERPVTEPPAGQRHRRRLATETWPERQPSYNLQLAETRPGTSERSAPKDT